MRVLAVLLIAVCGRSESPAPAPNRLTSEEKKAGWRVLFDGKTLKGWVDPARKSPPADSFTVEDGCIRACAKPKFREDLISEATFRDFELAWEWRIAPGSNSGVKYRIQDFAPVKEDAETMRGRRFEDVVEIAFRKKPWTRADLAGRGQIYVVAFEYQMIDDERHADARRGGKYSSGALYDLAAPSRSAAHPPGEWNQSRIVLQGKHVQHWLNGAKVVDTSLEPGAIGEGLARRWGATSRVYELLSGQPRVDCPIGLQNHGDDAWFRNIKIRKL